MKSDSTSTIADRIRTAAKAIGGLSEVSRRTGIPLRSLNGYVRKDNPVDLPFDRAALIAKATGVSLDWVASGDGEKLRQDLPLRRLPSADKPAYEMPERLGLAEERSLFISHSSSVDAELLRDVVTAIERALTDKNAKITPEQKAEAVIYLYESSTTEHAISEAALARVLRLVA